MSLTTTTQKPLLAHTRYLMTPAMPAAANKRNNDAAIEPNYPSFDI
ncbi:MAG: hypothetical protein KAF91_13885 [Nostoc sp. TH1S01]|nr:hypothetical protein [Nostoc sp. TH1S01]